MEGEKAKVLDLFCGMGGWSIPFIEDGDEVWGVDIKDYGYPGKLIKADIRELDGYGFWDMDLIIGSPPCNEFSLAKWMFSFNGYRPKPDIEKGLILVKDFYRFIREAQPKFWAMENVSRLEQWWKQPPIWRFTISLAGKRTLWGNFPIPLSPEYRFRRRFAITKPMREKKDAKIVKRSQDRAMIPYPIARFVADTVSSLHTQLKDASTLEKP